MSCSAGIRSSAVVAEALAKYPVRDLNTGLSYSTIQEAINNAADGDTIFVNAGTYYEHIVINKTLSLLGEDVSTTLIDGNSTGHVIHIVSDHVNVTGFTVQKSGNVHMPALEAGICLNNSADCVVSGNYLVDNGFCGISLLYSDWNIIVRNNITRSSWGGIHLLTSSHNIVSRNIVDNTYGGINGHASSHNNNFTENVISNSTYGMFYNNANYNNICRNNISTIAVEGIWLQEQVSFNIVAENRLMNNKEAIRLQGSNDNALSGNVITESEYGIRIGQYSNYNTILQNNITENICGFFVESSAQNTIYNNNLIENNQQISVTSGSINTWDGGYPSGGNYWSDHDGTDLCCGVCQNETGSDGIADSPYIINAGNKDKYPLMNPWTPQALSADINDDGKVNILDITIVAKAFGSEPGDPNWSAIADLDKNGLINIVDITLVAKDFGKYETVIKNRARVSSYPHGLGLEVKSYPTPNLVPFLKKTLGFLPQGCSCAAKLFSYK